MELCGGNAPGWDLQDALRLECLPWGEVPEEQALAGAAGGHLICPNSFRQEFLQGWIFTEKEYMLKSVLAVYRALVEKMEASKISVLLEVLLHRRQWHPIPVSRLENPRDGGAWWAAVCGVAQSWTRLK